MAAAIIDPKVAVVLDWDRSVESGNMPVKSRNMLVEPAYTLVRSGDDMLVWSGNLLDWVPSRFGNPLESGDMLAGY